MLDETYCLGFVEKIYERSSFSHPFIINDMFFREFAFEFYPEEDAYTIFSTACGKVCGNSTTCRKYCGKISL